MFSFRPARTTADALASYAELFRACFPHATHLDTAYLRWLYALNPAGSVIGMDAMHGDVLAAHYVCVPVNIWLLGERRKALLSLNTATHPNFQGQGLFTTLAKKTYELGASDGAMAVFGVANANSTPGFIRKLGFQLVAPLEARIGIGRPLAIDWSKVAAESEFRRSWTAAELSWRARSPANPLYRAQGSHLQNALFARTNHRGIDVWGETELSVAPETAAVARPSTLRLFLGLYPTGSVRHVRSMTVPSLLRPSPLNLIYRDLQDDDVKLQSGHICFNFFDFDAY